MVRENPPLELLRPRCLSFDLVFQAFRNTRHLSQSEVVLRHLVAEFLPCRFHQRFRIAFFQTADEQPEESPNQPADSPHSRHSPSLKVMLGKTKCIVV